MKSSIHISCFMTTCLLLAACGGVSESPTSSWTYEKSVDPVTKLVTHESFASFFAEGSVTGESTVEMILLCEKENDPGSLFLEVSTFEGEDNSAESGLDMGDAIKLRFNGSAIGPIKREGTEFINNSRWPVAVLNLVPLFDSFKDREELAPFLSIARIGQLFGIGDAENPVQKISAMAGVVAGLRFDKDGSRTKLIGPYQHRIWDDEFVFAASTSSGDLSVSASLGDASARKTVEACGFTYGPAPEKIEAANPQETD